ncbi:MULTISPECIES: coenzyme F420-0:L-glutamate ligase [Peptoniphilus]|uniref:coenzyme F420-0:L-glutamate ligase n=1 Tax=Peptoniphilus TaxID=162289 RepID=UPI0029006317|nr:MULTISPECIES: coenzyme F420-0:L-glutamate ligase [Peptoniphilus]MDU1043695.1 coenzyme F420-0:L-glutamate ligase [Peptoniphilus rhinitidis]MDU2110231.1 coenzyme F420-0:L-glutamate ligase [Peptoniphilus lacydonensis]MDU2115481.1 coenzyme F420-0:L-glutamate ligase [Peptoniphilus lacydonensis]MDU3750763.1 coenzyme F420-0:L-glutamate ligase [Peptoniphilus rhinitidis]
MQRYIGTVVRGIRTPIVKSGDNLVDIVVDSLDKAIESENISMHDKDVVAVTESLVARAQNNYVTTSDIAEDINKKYDGEIGIVFPILSRNRFSTILRGIAKSGKKVHFLFSYPSDEVGNSLMDPNLLYETKINPFTDVLEEKDYRKIFGEVVKHEFTGIDYVTLYKEICNGNCEIHFSNDPKTILNYTDEILIGSTHTRFDIKRILKDQGAKTVLGLDDLLNESINGSGYNKEFGLLGSNFASETKLKLFPRDGETFVNEVQKKLNEKYNKEIEVMIYGDGAFKDPVGKIWELADPVVSPAHTKGLSGTPSELKIKYIADTDLKDMDTETATAAMKEKISHKNKDLVGKDETLGTTPRRITDLLGSLCDLTSGSGDKGTPVVLIQGYFDNFATE